VSDLYLATVVVGVLGLAGFLLTFHFGRRVSRRTGTIVCGAIVALVIAHVAFVSDRLWVTRVLPLASIPILGTALLVIAVGALAGMAWRVIPGHVVRRGLLIVPLVAICLHRVIAAVFVAQPAPLSDRWKGDVALQTSAATCSPAAAATLLRAHGIDASESEMAALCLTSDRGTTVHGLYRGLKLKTAGTPWDIEGFHLDVAGLRALTGPSILTVRLDWGPGIDPRYERLWGWTPGVAHSVVCYGFTSDGKVNIGDPGVGKEQWNASDLHVLWHGEGLRLVTR
jgi:hypothetical protein